jgi:antitoxin component YwqK of YwqJK toxin-antitoxin module
LNKLINIIVVLLAALLLYGCKIKIPKHENVTTNPLVFRNGLLYIDSTSTVPYTGRNKSRMMDQVIEYDVVNGIKDGDFIIYYSNQKIQMIGKMSNNKNVGEWKYYKPDGSLETIGHYSDDKPTGTWIWYYPNGKIAEEGNYNFGKRDGKWKTYDTSSTSVIIRTYKDEKLIDSTSQDETIKTSN